ncbi:hypothetical protein QJQ45_012826 [Haematococcus lacustris]|nr:hypothetical protein QJQ45_012826 [Haematococcus lacustris]
MILIIIICLPVAPPPSLTAQLQAHPLPAQSWYEALLPQRVLEPGIVSPAGQVIQRLARPAWSLRQGKYVRGMQWCHEDQPPAQPPPSPVPRRQAPPWGRWLDRDINPCLNFQRIGKSMHRPLELCSWTDREALPPIGKEYQQRYKRVNDRLPKGRQRLHRAAEYRRGLDGRVRNDA